MKATKTAVQQRVDEILRIRLDGAEFWDVLQYVAEKQTEKAVPWAIPEGGKPLSERTVWWYIQQADKRVAESCREGRKKAVRRHLAQRRALYARAVNTGDLSTALRVLADEATLLDLYPAKKSELSGKGGGPVVLNITEEIVGRESAALGNIVEEIVTHDSNNDPPPSGTAGVSPQ